MAREFAVSRDLDMEFDKFSFRLNEAYLTSKCQSPRTNRAKETYPFEPSTRP